MSTRRSPDADVVVVGGGPAGASAATTLARAGRRVVVVDRARFPRDKCCGDGLTAAALRRLEQLGLSRSAVRSWTDVGSVSVRSTSGRTAEFVLPEGRGTYAAVARRADLDSALLALASEAGGTVLDGRALGGVEISPHSVRVEVRGLGELVATFAIGADGMWSTLRKLAQRDSSPPGYLGEWHAQRQYFSRVPEESSRRMWVWFEPDLLPGYAWSFPLSDGMANVGFGIRRGGAHSTGEMQEIWRGLLALPHVREVLGDAAVPHSSPRTWPIPAQLRPHLLHAGGGRLLFAGDAARAGDPLTGEGIAQALETGMAAGAAIASRWPGDPHEVARSYVRRVARGLGVDSRVSSALSKILANDLGARGALRAAGRDEWTRRRFARWLMEDYPRGLVLTPWRWARGAMSAPGAYMDAP